MGAYIAGMPAGWDVQVLGEALRHQGRPMVLVVPDDKTMAQYAALVAFFHPDIPCLTFPPWDCVPFDRLSPKPPISGARVACLTQLQAYKAQQSAGAPKPWLLLTTPEAFIQKIPSPQSFSGHFLTLVTGQPCERDALQAFCEAQGYTRVGTVYEPGEYALRGGLIDLFPPQAEAPIRIDFFDTIVESIRVVEPISQRSGATLQRLILGGVREVPSMVDAPSKAAGKEDATRLCSKALFRDGFRQNFGPTALQDPKPTRLLQGRHVEGAEHWLPLFYEEMGCLSDYLPTTTQYVWLSPRCDEVASSFLEEIQDNYDHRLHHRGAPTSPLFQAAGGSKTPDNKAGRKYTPELEPVYRALPPETLYRTREAWLTWHRSLSWWRLGEDEHPAQTPSDATDPQDALIQTFSAGGRKGKTYFSPHNQEHQSISGVMPRKHLYRQVLEDLAEHWRGGKKILLVAKSHARLQRLTDALGDAVQDTAHDPVDDPHEPPLVQPAPSHPLPTITYKPFKRSAIATSTSPGTPPLEILTGIVPGDALPHGFTTPNIALVTDGDIMGHATQMPLRGSKSGEALSGLDQRGHPRGEDHDAASHARRVQDLIASMTDFAEGDYVVHFDHGIGRYMGLKTISVVADDGSSSRSGKGSTLVQDFIEILYADNAKLLVPVENLDLLSRFGSGENEVTLDKLGGSSWQTRRAKVRRHLMDVAETLINTAAERQLQSVPPLAPIEGLYETFCQGFDYDLTPDQARAEQDIIADFAHGVPMDRLVCGDAGFGKTEVALRAAFMAVCQSQQVVVVVPTTLLCRQHYKTFANRFAPFDVKVKQVSRLVAPPQAKQTRQGCQDGSVNILITTHAAFNKKLHFGNLGLVILDEEQHFGVTQKEYLKTNHPKAHLLTLSATPIPRTLQLSLTGIKSMSLIATPPVSRLAVRTFVMPYDAMIIREAIMREYFRGGQCFYVCPRLKDLSVIEKSLHRLVPEVSIAIAHGQLPPQKLETIMQDFCDGKYDVLLSTNIVESGIDIPSANTLFVHRADLFGLAQLYQLRGRVGRSKTRGYAYFTLTPGKKISTTAKRRLKVMASLDALGAGFTIASHDMDIRGAGNLVGEAQAGHIQEVGVDLYQQLLKEAVAAKKAGITPLGKHPGGDELASQPADKAEDHVAINPTLNIGLSAYLPEHYIDDISLRLTLYKRLASCTTKQELLDITEEFADRFGSPPTEVHNLLALLDLKLLARQAGISKVDAGRRGAVVTFYNNSFPNPVALIQYIQNQKGLVSLRPDHKLVLNRALQDPMVRLRSIRSLVQTLCSLLHTPPEKAGSCIPHQK